MTRHGTKLTIGNVETWKKRHQTGQRSKWDCLLLEILWLLNEKKKASSWPIKHNLYILQSLSEKQEDNLEQFFVQLITAHSLTLFPTPSCYSHICDSFKRRDKREAKKHLQNSIYIYIENAELWTWAALELHRKISILYSIIRNRSKGRREKRGGKSVAGYNTTSFHEICQSLRPIGGSERSRALASSPPFKEVKQVITPGYITLRLCQTLCHPLKKEAADREPGRRAGESPTLSFGASPCSG